MIKGLFFKNRDKKLMSTFNNSRIALAILVLGMISFLGPNCLTAQTVSTPIVGFSKVSAPSGTIVVVPSFVKANRFQGAVILSGQNFAVPGFTSNQLAPSTYTDGRPNYPKTYVEITSGPLEGTVLDILSNTASSVTVSGAPSELNGQSVPIAIRDHFTLDDLAQSQSGLVDYDSGVTLYNSDGTTSIRYYVAGSWVSDDYSTPAGNTIIYPGQGITLSTGPATLTLSGIVKPTKTVIPLYAGGVVNLVGPGNPSGSSSLDAVNIAGALAPFDDGINSFSSNGLMTIAETYYSDGSVILDSSYEALASPAYVQPNSGFVVTVSSPKTWVLPKIVTP